ncbi:MAG TPA: alkaline phosphatase D family protein [Acidimicrobiales bacterium]|nr:alkaline phosphatase D family protein [Acidimicrobiales bacterium]
MGLATVQEGKGLILAQDFTGPVMARFVVWPASVPGQVTTSGWVASNRANMAMANFPTLRPPPGSALNWRADTYNGSAAPVQGPQRALAAWPAVGERAQWNFAFGSCATQVSRLVPALGTAAKFRPKFFAFLGDMGYRDGEQYPVQDYASYSRMFRDFLGRPDMAALLGTTAFFGMQDDHDYGKDDCDRSTVKPYTVEAYADLVPGASADILAYRSWRIGGVDFFLTDNRRDQDPPRLYQNGRYRSVLGQAQRDWLMSGLAASTARVKVVFVPMTPAYYWSGGERSELLRFIATSVSGVVIFLSGDKHAGAFARYSERCWELLAGPLRNPVKHNTPYRRFVLWTENGTGRSVSDCFGLVEVDTLVNHTVTLRLMSGDGPELHRQVVPLS